MSMTNFASQVLPMVLSLRSRVNELEDNNDKNRVISQYRHILKNELQALITTMYDDTFKVSIELASDSCQSSMESSTQTGVAIGEITAYLGKLDNPDISYDDMTKYIINGIRMIKNNLYGLTHEQKHQLIAVLNKHIIRVNWFYKLNGKAPYCGIILQLRKSSPNDVCDVTCSFKLRCRVCGQVVYVQGVINSDVYAPPYCKKCSSANLIEESSSWEDTPKSFGGRICCCA